MKPEIFAAICVVESVQETESSVTDPSWTGQGSSKHQDD